MRLNPETLARASSRHPWRTVGVWLVIFVLAGSSSSARCSARRSHRHRLHEQPGGEGSADRSWSNAGSSRTSSTENDRDGRPGEGAVDDPAFVEQVNAVLDDLRALGPGRRARRSRRHIPLPDRGGEDPRVAALGPIPSEDGTGGAVHGDHDRRLDDAAENVDELDGDPRGHSTGGRPGVHARRGTSTEDFKTISEEDCAAARWSASSPRSSCCSWSSGRSSPA